MKIHSGRIVSGLLVASVALAFAAMPASAQRQQQQGQGQAQGQQKRAEVPSNQGVGTQPPNTAKPGGKIPGNVAIQLVEVAGGFVDPIHVASPKGGTGRLFVCERPGVIRIIDKNGKVLDEPFYDNKANTMFQFLEEGLYCVEFHPKFKENGLVYISYADMWFNGSTFVVEYHVDKSEPNKIDMASARPIIRIDFPY